MDPESVAPSLPPELCVLIFQEAADGMFVADPQGRLTAVNPYLCDSLGFSAEEVLGRPFLDFADPEDLRTNPLRLAELRAGKSVVSQRPLRHKEGRLLPFEFTLRMLPDGRLLGVARDINEHQRAERALSHSRDLMRYVIEHSRSAIAVHDRDLKYVYVSQHYLDEYKVKEQDVIGKHHYDVFPDLPQKWRDVHQRALAGEVSSAEDDPYVRDDGTVDWTRWECRPWYGADGSIGGIIVYTEVITERKRAEEAAKAGEALLRDTMAAVADGVLVVDDRGAVVFQNARFAELWRIPPEVAGSNDHGRLLGFVLDQLEDPEAFQARVQTLYASDERSFDSLSFKDGRVFERFSCPLMRGDAIGGRVWSFRDVTERRVAEVERLEMERRLLHAQKLESLGVLAGGIAHDFNNILMAILGNLELGLRELSPVSPVRSRLDAASNAARRAADLTRQMLAFSGRGRFMVGRLDLSKLAEENSHLLRTSIPRTTTMNLDLDRALPAVEADAGQIQQVMMNLITNASEAIGGEPGVITLSTGARDCDAAYLGRSRLDETPPAGRYTYFEVADTGCGMDEQTQKRMFEPFFTTKFTGRGLGMSAVLGIVRGHHGAILLDSAVGAGTTIRVLFPAVETGPGAALPAGDAPAAGGAVAAGGAGRGTILVVDDEEMVLQPCVAMMESMGFAVLTAMDGVQVVEVVRRHGASIRAILLDLTMPNLDGAGALEQILRIEPGAKVILSSGYDEADATGSVAKERLAGFIRKPYDLEQLQSTLSRVLGTAP